MASTSSQRLPLATSATAWNPSATRRAHTPMRAVQALQPCGRERRSDGRSRGTRRACQAACRPRCRTGRWHRARTAIVRTPNRRSSAAIGRVVGMLSSASANASSRSEGQYRLGRTANSRSATVGTGSTAPCAAPQRGSRLSALQHRNRPRALGRRARPRPHRQDSNAVQAHVELFRLEHAGRWTLRRPAVLVLRDRRPRRRAAQPTSVRTGCSVSVMRRTLPALGDLTRQALMRVCSVGRAC